ncbi:MAG: hypothetical protein Tsb0020_42680 [Haliangiales bacterium]
MNPTTAPSTPISSFRGRTSRHFEARSSCRGVPENLLDRVLTYGTEFKCRGMIHYTLVKKNLPPVLAAEPWVPRTLNWIVLVSEDGTLVTCYRRANAVRYLRRKPKRRRDRDIDREPPSSRKHRRGRHVGGGATH